MIPHTRYARLVCWCSLMFSPCSFSGLVVRCVPPIFAVRCWCCFMGCCDRIRFQLVEKGINLGTHCVCSGKSEREKRINGWLDSFTSEFFHNLKNSLTRRLGNFNYFET